MLALTGSNKQSISAIEYEPTFLSRLKAGSISSGEVLVEKVESVTILVHRRKWRSVMERAKLTDVLGHAIRRES